MASRIINYPPNAIIYFNGDKANSVYLIKEGQIRLEYFDIENGSLIKDTLNTGDFFGVKSGLIHFPREEDAKVIKKSQIIEFSTDDFEQLIVKNTNIILKMLKSFSNQLRRAGKQMQKLITNKAETDSVSGLFLIGDYYYKAKKYTKALTVYNRFLIYYSEHPLAEHAKQRIADVQEAFDSFGDGGGPTPSFENVTF
ncbi:MAG: Crp/Fnr family transcriptional regulator [Spirochaetales bacterium]|nr:Crp/Fnr family transcriptional regulator [Spirochaetales bacterium]